MVLVPVSLGLLVSLIFVYLFLFVYNTSPKSSSFVKITELISSILGCILFYRYYDWKADIWAVTNARIINVWGVFARNVKESPLDKINNVSFNQSFLGLVLCFGDVEVQTAAEQGVALIKFIKDPELLQTTIVRCQDNKL